MWWLCRGRQQWYLLASFMVAQCILIYTLVSWTEGIPKMFILSHVPLDITYGRKISEKGRSRPKRSKCANLWFFEAWKFWSSAKFSEIMSKIMLSGKKGNFVHLIYHIINFTVLQNWMCPIWNIPTVMVKTYSGLAMHVHKDIYVHILPRHNLPKRIHKEYSRNLQSGSIIFS